MKRIIVIILILSFIGCGTYVEIEQKQKISSFLTNKCRLTTCVWVTDWKGMPISLEYNKSYTYLCHEDIDEIIISEHNKALEIKRQLEIIITAGYLIEEINNYD